MLHSREPPSEHVQSSAICTLDVRLEPVSAFPSTHLDWSKAEKAHLYSNANDGVVHSLLGI